MRSLIKLWLLHAVVFVSCKYSANIPDFTPPFAKDILEFAKKYRYKIDYKHGIRLFRTNETLNVSSEYDHSQAKEYFICEVNSSYEVDDEDLSTAISWMDDKTTPRSVEKMTLNISDYHFNIDKQFAHQLDYDFNDSFPVASQQYSDDGIEEPCVRNYFVKRNESYYLKDHTELFSSYERQFLPTVKDDLKWTFCPPKTTTPRNFSQDHASNPYKRFFRAMNTEFHIPHLDVGSDEVTRLDYPTTLTEYREPFFVYVHRLSETNVTFYHNNRKYHFRDGTMIRDLNGLKYFVPNVTYPRRKTRKTASTILFKTYGTVRKIKANIRSKMKNSKTVEQDKLNSRVIDRSNEPVRLEELGDLNQTVDNKITEELHHDHLKSSQVSLKNNHSKINHVHRYLMDRLESLVTTTSEPTTTQSTYIQPLFTLPPINKRWAPIRIGKPDPNVVTFVVRVPRNASFIFIGDKRSLHPNVLKSSVLYVTNIKSDPECERNFAHLNMNLFGRHRNHKLFTSTTTTRRPRSNFKTTTSKTSNVYTEVYSYLTIEVL